MAGEGFSEKVTFACRPNRDEGFGRAFQAEGTGRAEALSVFGEHSAFKELLRAPVPRAGEHLREYAGGLELMSERHQVAARARAVREKEPLEVREEGKH